MDAIMSRERARKKERGRKDERLGCKFQQANGGFAIHRLGLLIDQWKNIRVFAPMVGDAPMFQRVSYGLSAV
jgi:hypothetical protein